LYKQKREEKGETTTSPQPLLPTGQGGRKLGGKNNHQQNGKKRAKKCPVPDKKGKVPMVNQG